MLDDTTPRSAERQTRRQLSVSRLAAGKEQTADVGTGDDQQQGDRRRHQAKRALDVLLQFAKRGRQIVGKTMLLLLNARRRPIPFTLPKDAYDSIWQLEFDTAVSQPETLRLMGGSTYQLQPFSMAVLRLKSRRWSFLKFGIDTGGQVATKPHVAVATEKTVPVPAPLSSAEAKPALPKESRESQRAKAE